MANAREERGAGAKGYEQKTSSPTGGTLVVEGAVARVHGAAAGGGLGLKRPVRFLLLREIEVASHGPRHQQLSHVKHPKVDFLATGRVIVVHVAFLGWLVVLEDPIGVVPHVVLEKDRRLREHRNLHSILSIRIC